MSADRYRYSGEKTERPSKKRDGWQLYNTYATIRVYRVINVSAKCQ